MCRTRSFQFLVDRASDGGFFTSVLRTKMAIPRVLPGEATVFRVVVSFLTGLRRRGRERRGRYPRDVAEGAHLGPIQR
jgi:hypothetical protein